MTTGYFKLDLGQEVAPADVPGHLGGGAFTVLRVDTQGGKTTVHFSGDAGEVAKTHSKAAAVKLEDIAKV